MRFLIDECSGPGLAKWLRGEGHEVFSVYDETPGSDDETIIRKAFDEKWILITNDKDFGDRIFRDRMPHSGVIFLRLANERSANKIRVVENLLKHHAENLLNNFVVVTESRIRFSKS